MIALPTIRPMGIRESYSQAWARIKTRHEENALRALLGRWVSELEPTVVRDVRGGLLGLAWVGDPKAEIVVHAG